MNNFFKIESISVKPIGIYLYIPPIVWKGDSVGHIGENDLFFFVLEGECFLNIDSESHIVKPGQLAYLPKGKRRAYTHISERFTMYEMAFSATANGENIMDLLGLTKNNYVIDIADVEQMRLLFETSHRKELFKNPIYDISWCANILNIIRIYTEERQKTNSQDSIIFKPVLQHMTNNIDKSIKTEEFAAIVYMQPTYFIRRFKKCFGMPPGAYFNRLKIYKTMGMLAGTELPVEEIASSVGIDDTSYFARLFKKYCGVSPSKYRMEFKKI